MTAVLACVCLGWVFVGAAFACDMRAAGNPRDRRVWWWLAASCLCVIAAVACLVRVATENLSP